MKKKILLAAGGTGGHINAAKSLGDYCQKNKGCEVYYITGKRHLDYKLFKGENVYHLAVYPLRVKGVIRKLTNLLFNFKCFIELIIKIAKLRPSHVIGCGGYVCGPVLLSAKLLGIPIYVVEQNAIAGFTNRLLSKISKINFVNFKQTKGIEKNVFVSGNPIRSNIVYQSSNALEAVSDSERGKVNILVFGGSLGATQINKAIELLISEIGPNYHIRHQVGDGNLSHKHSENYTEHEYLDDIASDYAWAHVIIARAGASTISELQVVQRPCILIPYPNAVDNHQYYNALALKESASFRVEVIDKNLEGRELMLKLYETLKNIEEQKDYLPKVEKKAQDVPQIIFNKIGI